MNIFSFDAESDGLYGDIFAIGAVVVTEDGEILDEFKGMAEVESVKDSWVKDNVLPACESLPKYHDKYAMRFAFWLFWLKHRESCICVADFGAPVEALLFRQLVNDDLAGRMWQGPYPMHELGTALLLAGEDPDVDRIKYACAGDVKKHNPVDDAAVAAACWIKARQLIQGYH